MWLHIFWIPQFHKGCKLLAVNSLYVYAVTGSGAFPHLYRRVWLRGVPPSLLTVAVKCLSTIRQRLFQLFECSLCNCWRRVPAEIYDFQRVFEFRSS